MQLKGLVKFFTIVLIIVCVFLLSLTWFVHNHENKMEDRAEKWLTAMYPTAAQKYPGSEELQTLYADTLRKIKEARVREMLDSTKNDNVVLGLISYKWAKSQELMLGLDLQGGTNVTLEVGMNDLIHSLANKTKDPAFTKALESAVAKKATGGQNLITLFRQEFEAANANAKLAPFFAQRSNGKLKFDATNSQVEDYLHAEEKTAFENTTRIITKRIDQFGVASPGINPDPARGIINIELAGLNDPERVRRNLQSTANLQFFDVYTWQTPEVDKGLDAANKIIQAQLNNFDSATAKRDSTGKIIEDSLNANPVVGLFSQITPPYQDPKTGKVIYPGTVGYMNRKDTSKFNTYMRMDIVKQQFPANLVFMFGPLDDNKGNVIEDQLTVYAIKTLDNGSARLEGDKIEDANPSYDQYGKPAVSMTMNAEGARIWADMTGKAYNAGTPIAIVLDNFVYSAPGVNNGAITGGQSQISGNFSVEQATDLANTLKSGKLDAPARIVQQQEIGASLGEEAVKGGALSFIIAFGIIFILMLVYYNTAGWVANIALVLNLLFTIAVLSALGATITAPAIAGLVLTIGIAVDTNVLIFERIKEELTKGKSYATAVNDGYKRSLAPVLDAHITSLLTAVILFIFGLGPVLGFATTQIIGIILSLYCGIVVSRLITDIYTQKQRHFEYFTSISRKIFKHAQFKFIEYRKVAYVISFVVLGLGIGAWFNGFDQGVEFAGGRSYTVKFDKAHNTREVADNLKASLGNELPIVKTIDNARQLSITTAYKIHETGGDKVDEEVREAIYNGLKNYLPAGLTYNEFKTTKYLVGSQKVLPTISEDLKKGAVQATIWAVVLICLYIFIRFRDWRYSLGTIVSLLHDILVTLIVFSFCRNIVPFPLEIDQHFIAAILTVIGFSMNDTVIVYDRIREDGRLYPNMDKGTLINKAINQTLTRTVMTSLTVFLTILVLFIFGGEVTRGFAFAMLVGVITGTYSSIFVAAPILMDFAKDKPLGKKS